jgi:predicted porin
MKKTLIALAVLGLSGAVMAQSSVTLYGTADAGVVKLGLPDKSNKVHMGSGAGDLMTNGDSRLGVRGNEDLGGGLNVGFNFETRLNLGNGAYLGKNPTKQNPNGDFWSPMSKVWIGGNWGTFSMGRSLTPSFDGVAAWELTGAANYSLVGNTYGWGGTNPRDNSQFTYKTPNLNGFTAEIAFVTKTDMQSFTGQNGAKWDINAVYANGPITVSLVANKVQGSKTNWSLGGRYNFGNFIMAASYNDAHDITGYSNHGSQTGSMVNPPLVAGLTRRAGVTLGGTALFGPFSATLDVSRDTKRQFYLGQLQGAATSTSNRKLTNVLAEAKYSFSKRTLVYLAYLRRDVTNNYGLGLRHNF